MKKERIKELRDLIAASTPGPWKNDCGNGQVETTDWRILICERVGNYERKQDAHGMYGDKLPQEVEAHLKHNNENDMDLIAEAPTALSEALDEIDRLNNYVIVGYEQMYKEMKTEIDRLKEELNKRVNDGYPNNIPYIVDEK